MPTNVTRIKVTNQLKDFSNTEDNKEVSLEVNIEDRREDIWEEDSSTTTEVNHTTVMEMEDRTITIKITLRIGHNNRVSHTEEDREGNHGLQEEGSLNVRGVGLPEEEVAQTP